MEEMIEVGKSDLLKILDALQIATRYLEKRDEMNSVIHLSTEVRYSPITSRVSAEEARLRTLLEDLATIS